jgi:iron complex outermembrane receptor protein
MANPKLPRRRALPPAALLCGLTAASFHAASPAQTASDAAERVTVVAPKPAGDVTGFGDVPASQAPFQVDITTQEQMKDDGIRRLSDIGKVDPSVNDGYNAVGYYDFISVRGFVLDNRFNYRREGLPISAETTIPLDNKSRIEVLKGINGFQAGVGSPGGLVNAVVKRPTAQPIREAFVGWQQDGSLLGSVDLGDRFGADKQFGLRLNTAAERIDPQVRDARGERWLAALAGEWQVTADTLLEAEVEFSRRSQPSVPGFSVLGSVVPEPGDPDINLNDQAWSQPSVFGSTVGTLRWRQNLGGSWRLVAIAGSQQLTTDDRIAFPYGCSQEGFYDRFCSDGTYDLYDFRSDDEKRRTHALDVSLAGAFETGAVRHALTVGVQLARATVRTQPLAFNFAGIGNVEGTLMVPPAPDPTTPGSNRDSDSDDLYLRDALAFGDHDTLWLGLRYTRQKTRTWLTDGTQQAGATQSFASPWVAYTHRFDAGVMAYASWGQGYESDIVPNTPLYANRGQALSSLRSRQFELGLKGLLALGGCSVEGFVL